MIIKIIIGTLLIVNEKYISRRFKYSVIVIYFYEIIGCIFYIFNINFSEILGVYNYDIDYKTIYVALIFSIILTVISYIVFRNKNNFIKIVEENKYFWIGNYFVMGAVIGFCMFPIYGPGDWNEMSIELLNFTDDFQVNCLVMFEVVILIAYREYKKTITNI